MSQVEVDKIIPQSGTTLTIGDSGDTITIPSGVTLSTASFSSTGIDDNATSTAITIDSSQNVGIGTASPDRLLHVKSTGNTRAKIEAGTASTFGQLYLGTENQFIIGYGSTHPTADALSLKNLNASGTIRFFNSGDYERMRIDSSGNVGIGTSSPSSALDIIGGLTIDGNNNIIEHNITRQTGTTNASRPVIKLTAKNTASDVTDGFGSAIQFRMKDDTADVELGAIGFIRDGADGSGAFAVGQDSQLLQSSPQFIVKSNGNVGIGETAPLGNFHIKSGDSATTSVDSLANELVVESSSSGGMTILTPASSTGNIFFGDPNNNTIGRIQYAHASDAMLFITNSAERMRIDSVGSVGIGTTAPFNSRPGSFTLSNTAPTIYLEDTDSSSYGVGQILYQNGDLAISSGSRNGTGTTNTSEFFRITNAGNVGIGTTSPDSILDLTSTPNNNFIHFNATTGGLNGDIIGGFEVNNVGGTIGKLTVNRESTSSSGYMAFQTGTTEKMRITNSGNVGIGTSSPSRKLHVLGPLGTAQIQSTSTASTLYFGDTNSTSIDNQGIGSVGTDMIVIAGGLERVRINNAGKIFTNQTAQFHNCVTIGGAVFTGDFQIEVSGLTPINGNSHRKWGMRLSYASIAGNATDSQQKDVLLTINGLTSYSGVSPIDTGGGTIAVSVDSATSTSVTFTVTTPGASTVGAYVATLFANDNSTMECNG